MTAIVIRPERAERAYAVRFHVRAPARARPDEIEQRLHWSLDRTIRRLERQGWTFVRLSEQAPRGPLPVVPVKGFGRRPSTGAKTPMAKDDALWRVSSLPTFGPKAAHLMTDEVDWEYTAIFHRPAIATEHEEEPSWPKR